MKQFTHSIRAAFCLVALCTLLFGFIYPLLVTAAAQLLFHHKAGGSLIVRGDKIIGSSLLGQEFTEAKYFWGRLSATTPPYNAAASGGSNFSPANPKLLKAASERIGALQRADAQNRMKIPVELITASGSGLDPHISLMAAEYQLARVARARGMKTEALRALVKNYIETNGFGLLGAPYVNVVKLNMALDEK